jgi:hypothetical protein
LIKTKSILLGRKKQMYNISIRIIALFISQILLITSSNSILLNQYVSPHLNALVLSEDATDSVISNDETINKLLSIIENKVVDYSDDIYEVYGNTNISDKGFRDIVNGGSNKIYLHYRTTVDVDLPYDALLKIKTDKGIYSYEFIETVRTNSDDLLSQIKSFVLRSYNDSLLETREAVSTYVTTGSSNVPTTFISCATDKTYTISFGEQGYLIIHIGVSVYEANESSILYIVTVNNSFVPGIVGEYNSDHPELDSSIKYKNYKIDSGYVHMVAEQAYDKTEKETFGIREGTIPYYKDHWPLNDPAVVSINSTVTAGVMLGHSFENGFSLDNISLQGSSNKALNVSYSYSKTITQSEPALSVQQSAENLDLCQWSFWFEDLSKVTYNQQTNYMFEMENSRAELFIGDFRLQLYYKFVLDRGLFYASSTNYGHLDLFVRAGEYNDIYSFSGGMI